MKKPIPKRGGLFLLAVIALQRIPARGRSVGLFKAITASSPSVLQCGLTCGSTGHSIGIKLGRHAGLVTKAVILSAMPSNRTNTLHLCPAAKSNLPYHRVADGLTSAVF